MPFEREPIFHDRQTQTVVGPVNTSSASFVDIPGAIITTKDLGSPGNYNYFINAEVSHDQNNSQISFRATFDGVPGPDRTISRGPNSANDPVIASFIAESSDTEPDITIQLQWSTPSGTATLSDLVFILDGIPEIRVIN